MLLNFTYNGKEVKRKQVKQTNKHVPALWRKYIMSKLIVIHRGLDYYKLQTNKVNMFL